MEIKVMAMFLINSYVIYEKQAFVTCNLRKEWRNEYLSFETIYEQKLEG